MFFGDWEMRHHRDLQQEDAENYAAWCADWQHAAPTNGRASRRLPNASAVLPSPSQFRELDHLLIVGHQGVLSLLVAQLLNMPDSAMWHFPSSMARGALSISSLISPRCAY